MEIQKIIRSLADRYYNVGFVQNSLEGILNGEELNVIYVKHAYKDHWFADPFILRVTDRLIEVLVEDFSLSLDRGRISLLRVDRQSYELKELIPILTLPTHLSYPAVLRRDGDVYIYPESGASGKLQLYKLDIDSLELHEHRVLAVGDIADSTITTLFGEEIMFATEDPHKDGKILGIYRLNDEGLFVKTDEILFDEVIARSAGDLFEYHGIVIRPAQESNEMYGHAVVLQQITKQNDGMQIKELRRLYAPSKKYPLGLHTFNMYQGVIVVDSIAYYHPFLAKLIRSCNGIIRKLSARS
jgi:hypothetical protein